MNNLLPVNRVETALNQWRLWEECLSKLFSFSLSSNEALLKEKLHYYEQIAAKYKGTQNLDERFALKVLRQKRKQMERELYSNFVSRLLWRSIIVPVLESIIVNKDNRKTEENNQSLRHQVQRAGFFGLSTKIAEQVGEGQQQFSIPVSYYVNDKERMDHQLSFLKDPSGQYYFEGFKTALYNEANPTEKPQQYFICVMNIKSTLRKPVTYYQAGVSRMAEPYCSSTSTIKTRKATSVLSSFIPDYGYDIDKTLQQLPLKELLKKEDAVRLKEALKNGHKASSELCKGCPLSLHPLFYCPMYEDSIIKCIENG